MTPRLFASFAAALHRTLEGELATLPAHARREQHRRQIALLHSALANLLLAIALLQGVYVAFAAALGLRPPGLAFASLATLALLGLALAFRLPGSSRRRAVHGLGFLGVLLAVLVEPGVQWGDASVLSLVGFLLLPLAGLPLLVRPRVAYGGLALCTLAAGLLLAAITDASSNERLAFAFYYLASVIAGLVLRRARGNLAVRLDREVEDLWQRAVKDPLTGLLNRQGWLNLATTAMQDALDAGQQPAVLFIDVDHFKRVNDSFGHQTGDDLLRELGGIIAARIESGQFAARLGGEEFACLLPRVNVHQAERFAQRLANDYSQRAQRFDSTLSIGVATYQAGDVLNDLLARADAALYEAKHRGRNQVIVAAN
jgi:diguanylate cyclase (GGDEF)-like protein